MEDNARVQIKCLIKGTVVLTDPNIPIRREWNKKGQIQSVPFGILQDLIYQPGVQAMFDEGILEVEDQKVRIELGLETEGVEPEKVIMSENQMLAALIGTPDDIAAALDKLPEAQKEEFVRLAVDKEFTDMAKVDVIKKKTGKDVLQLVKFNRQLKEESKSTNE